MEVEKVTIYEIAETDGYRPCPRGIFLFKKAEAILLTKHLYGNYRADPIPHNALRAKDNDFYLLKSEKPVFLYDSEKAKEEIKEKALAKLTDEEKELLGL